MKNKKFHFSLLTMLLISTVCLAAMVTFSSCGDDEPNGEVIDYYLSIEEEFLVDGSIDHTDRYFNPIARMKKAMREAYPTPNAQGDDDAVIAACDKEFETYQSFYTGRSEHLTCLFHLVRVTKNNGIIRHNETLKTYYYNINPPEVDPQQ